MAKGIQGGVWRGVWEGRGGECGRGGEGSVRGEGRGVWEGRRGECRRAQYTACSTNLMHWTHFNSRLQSQFIVTLEPEKLVNGL